MSSAVQRLTRSPALASLRDAPRQSASAARRLMAKPSYTLMALAVLSLGLGVMLLLLSTANTLIFKPLPFASAERLVNIGYSRVGSNSVGTLTARDYLRFRDELSDDAVLGGYYELTANLSAGGEQMAQRYLGTALSASVLELLGVAPLLGRGFSVDDDLPGAALTALLGWRVWQDDFAGDLSVVNTSLRINGELATIIGVLPADFDFPLGAEIFLPARLGGETAASVHTLARMQGDSSIDQLTSELQALASRLGVQLDGERKDRVLEVTPLREFFVDRTTASVLVLMLATGVLVLLLACVNVANLTLVHGISRRREYALRSALGASTPRLLRELLTESAMLCLAATALGLLLAELGSRWLNGVFAASEQPTPTFMHLGIDESMLGYALISALLALILCGLAPALGVLRFDTQSALRDGDKGSGRVFARFTQGLVVAEVALTVVLLAGAGVVIKHLHEVLDVDFGTTADPAQIITARVGLFPGDYPDTDAQIAFFERVAARLREDPQVIAASLASVLPGLSSDGHERVAARGEERPTDGYLEVLSGRIDEHFLETYGVALVAGRNFAAADDGDAEPVVLVDEQLARRLWPGRDPLGQWLTLEPDRAEPRFARVVGVTAAIHLEKAQVSRYPSVLLPWRQHPTRFVTIAARTHTPAAHYGPQLAASVRAEDANVPSYWIRTQAAAIAAGRIESVVLAQLFSAIGVLALVLAAAGLYGVLAFAVLKRTQEIGIRRALGAGRLSIITSVGGRVAFQVGLGLACGLLAAVWWSGVLGASLGIPTQGTQPMPMLALGVVVLSVTLAAVRPMQRAMRVEPIIALRHD